MFTADASDIGGHVIEADLDGVAFAGHANGGRSNIDIVISRSQVTTSRVAEGGVVVAGSVVLKREISGSRVAGAVEIVKEGLVTDGGVIVHIVVTKRA